MDNHKQTAHKACFTRDKHGFTEETAIIELSEGEYKDVLICACIGHETCIHCAPRYE